MINKINDVICFVFVAAVFAMVGHDVGNHRGMTHSGTQANCPINSSTNLNCHK